MKSLILTSLLLSSYSLYASTFKKCDVSVKIEQQKKSFLSKDWKTKNIQNRNPCWIGFMDLILRDEVGQPSSSSCGTYIDGIEYSVDVQSKKNEDGQFEIKLLLGDNDFGTDLTPNAFTLDQRTIDSSDVYNVSAQSNFIIQQEKRKRLVITNVAVNCIND